MKTLLIISLLALAGCATQAPRPTAAADPSNGCFTEIAYDARFVGLREKMAINLPPNKATLEMLSDPSTPTADERRMLSVWKVARETCFDAGAAFRAQYAPAEYRSFMSTAQVSINGITAQLYSGEITFGTFNRQRADIMVGATSRLEAAAQQQRTQAIGMEEDRRRAAASVAVQNIQIQQANTSRAIEGMAPQPYQIVQPQQPYQYQVPMLRGPTTTNCTRNGSQVNCTSY